MRGNALRSLLPALVVLALVGMVAIAATGSTPSGTDDSRPPAESLLDALFSLWLVMLVPAAAVLVYGLMQRKEIAREMATKRYHRSGLLGFMVFVFFLMGIVYWRMRNYGGIQFEDTDIRDVVVGESITPEVQPEAPIETYEAEFAWIPVAVVVALVAIGAAAAYLATRRRKAERGRREGRAGARRRPRRVARRPPGGSRPAPGRHRRLRAPGARSRRRTARPSETRRHRRST